MFKPRTILAALLLIGFSAGAHATNRINEALLDADCEGWTIMVTPDIRAHVKLTVDYVINLDPVAGGAPVMGTVMMENNTNFARFNDITTVMGTWASPLNGTFQLSGTVDLVNAEALQPGADTDISTKNVEVFNDGVPLELDCEVPEPAVMIVKEISVDGGTTYLDANDGATAALATAPAGALYRLTVSNTGTTPLTDLTINDAALGISDFMAGDLGVGESTVIDAGDLMALRVATACDAAGTIINIADVAGNDPAGTVVTDDDPAYLVCDEPPGGGTEGCTPGYWKQEHHYDSWVTYAPSDDFEAVFGVDASTSWTLGTAVKAKGGGENALARHAVAALLNAASSVDYLYSTAEVIAAVQDAYASGDFETTKDLLADENELGCPLN